MKTGIVLEGGAIRTIFSSGVTDALLDNDILTDYLVGTSAGIAYGVSYASKQSGRNLEILSKYVNDKRYMGVHHLADIRNRSYFNLKFTYDTIPNELVPFDYKAFASFDGEVEATVTNLNTGMAEYYPVPTGDKKFIILRASCAMPLLFPIYKINKQPCLDGGIADAIPFQRAFDKGCDRVLVVLTRERDYVKTDEKTLPAMKLCYARYPEFCKALDLRAELYNSNRQRLFELEKQGRALVIAPDSTAGFSRTERDLSKIKELYQSGYEQTTNRIDEIRSFLQKD